MDMREELSKAYNMCQEMKLPPQDFKEVMSRVEKGMSANDAFDDYYDSADEEE